MLTKKIAVLLLGVCVHNIQTLASTVDRIKVEAITAEAVFQTMSGAQAADMYDKWIKSYASLCVLDAQGDDLSKDLVRILYCVRQYKNLDGIRTIRSDIARYHEHRQYMDYDAHWRMLLNKNSQNYYNEFTTRP